MTKKDGKMRFAELLNAAIEDIGLKRNRVANAAGIHPTSFSKILNWGVNVAEPTANNLVNTLNYTANREIINLSLAMYLLGYIPEGEELLDIEAAEIYFNLKEKKRQFARRQILTIIRSYIERANDEHIERNGGEQEDTDEQEDTEITKVPLDVRGNATKKDKMLRLRKTKEVKTKKRQHSKR